jgi:hypothetical protein
MASLAIAGMRAMQTLQLADSEQARAFESTITAIAIATQHVFPCGTLCSHGGIATKPIRLGRAMASGRKPGPQCSNNDRVDIDDGTMCLAQSPTPGPLGPALGVLANIECGECVSKAFARAAQLAPACLSRETGHAFGDTSRDLIPDLVVALKDLSASAACAGGKGSILTSLGLEFLPESNDRGLAEMICVLQSGLSRAHNAGEQRSAKRDSEIEQAAAELALAIGILVRLILQGIVAYLLSRGSPATTRGTIATGPAGRTHETKIIADEVVAELVGQLRSSKLDGSLAPWVEQNWKDLLTNPQLRLRPRLSGGAVSADRVSSERRPRAPIPPSTPANDPPVFSSDTNLVAQAATLVAAAAQGAPFCPV